MNPFNIEIGTSSCAMGCSGCNLGKREVAGLEEFGHDLLHMINEILSLGMNASGGVNLGILTPLYNIRDIEGINTNGVEQATFALTRNRGDLGRYSDLKSQVIDKLAPWLRKCKETPHVTFGLGFHGMDDLEPTLQMALETIQEISQELKQNLITPPSIGLFLSFNDGTDGDTDKADLLLTKLLLPHTTITFESRDIKLMRGLTVHGKTFPNVFEIGHRQKDKTSFVQQLSLYPDRKGNPIHISIRVVNRSNIKNGGCAVTDTMQKIRNGIMGAMVFRGTMGTPEIHLGHTSGNIHDHRLRLRLDELRLLQRSPFRIKELLCYILDSRLTE